MTDPLRIGFCILSHKNESDLLALVDALNEVYDQPPIACHHDRSQSPIDTAAFPANVLFVEPSIVTGWGRFSVVRAGIAAIQQLFERFDPDWFVLLSAADIPIAPAAALREALSATDCDAFLDARPLYLQNGRTARTSGTYNEKLCHFADPDNVRMKRRFYLSPELWIPVIRATPKLRIGRWTYRWPWVAKAVKRAGLSIYYGDHWFMGNRRIARLLSQDGPNRRFLFRHLAARTQADECFYQTMVMNDPDLTVCLDNRRFAEWNGGGAHPMELTEAQIAEMRASNAFFARKVSSNAPVARALRTALGADGRG